MLKSTQGNFPSVATRAMRTRPTDALDGHAATGSAHDACLWTPMLERMKPSKIKICQAWEVSRLLSTVQRTMFRKWQIEKGLNCTFSRGKTGNPYIQQEQQ